MKTFSENELLTTFEYLGFILKLYYIGTDNVGYTITINNEIVYSNDDFKPSPLYNFDDPDCVMALLGFIFHFVSGADENEEFIKIPSLVDWVEENSNHLIMLMSDFDMKDDEEFLTVNEMTYEEATNILQFIY